MKKTSLKKNTVYNAIKTFSTIAFPFVVFPYVSRTILVENVGKINFGMSFVSYFSLLASLGINVYAIRESSKFRNNREKFSEIASQIFSINVFSTVLSYLLLFLFLFFYKEIANYRLIIVIQSSMILFTTLGTDWINTAMEDFKYITIRTVSFQLLSLILLFTLVHRPDDYLKYVIISSISTSGAQILNIFYRKKYCDLKFTLDVHFRQHIMPIVLLFAMLIAQTIFSNIDTTMLGILKGDFEVGIYSTAHKITHIIEQLVTSILWVILPRMSYYFGNNDYDSANKLFENIYNFTLTLGLPMVCGVLLLADDIIYLFAGAPFVLSSKVLKVLILSSLITFFGGSLFGNIVLLPNNEEKFLMYVCIATAAFNIIANRFLIPYFGAVGAATATVISALIIAILDYVKGKKYIDTKLVSKALIPPIVGCIAITIICFILSYLKSVLLRVLLSIPISVVIYFAIQFFLKNRIVLTALLAIKNKVKLENIFLNN